jgi:hypothetical protein
LINTSPLVLNLTTLYGTFITENTNISFYVDVAMPATQLNLTLSTTEELVAYYKSRKDNMDVH